MILAPTPSQLMGRSPTIYSHISSFGLQSRQLVSSYQVVHEPGSSDISVISFALTDHHHIRYAWDNPTRRFTKHPRISLAIVITYLRGSEGVFVFEAVFMHDPVALLTLRSSTFVKDQGFFHANKYSSSKDFFVFASGFPVASFSCSVCSKPSWVFSISQVEEVPFLFAHRSLACNIYAFDSVFRDHGRPTVQQVPQNY